MKGKEPFPFDLLFWNADATRMPRANHSFYLRSCYLDNQLSKGKIVVGGETIDLKRVTIRSTTSPPRKTTSPRPSRSSAAPRASAARYALVVSGSGHIAGVVNPPSRKKYQYWVGGEPKGTLDDWLEKAEERPGSWWDDWHTWIESQDPTRVTLQRTPGGSQLTPIEDAPGSYVMVPA
jgi:polyhydroxyalkanoate synthase